jgi:hypothetical protein
VYCPAAAGMGYSLAGQGAVQVVWQVIPVQQATGQEQSAVGAWEHSRNTSSRTGQRGAA